jgi:hypothetical protein
MTLGYRKEDRSAGVVWLRICCHMTVRYRKEARSAGIVWLRICCHMTEGYRKEARSAGVVWRAIAQEWLQIIQKEEPKRLYVGLAGLEWLADTVVEDEELGTGLKWFVYQDVWHRAFQPPNTN